MMLEEGLDPADLLPTAAQPARKKKTDKAAAGNGHYRSGVNEPLQDL